MTGYRIGNRTGRVYDSHGVAGLHQRFTVARKGQSACINCRNANVVFTVKRAGCSVLRICHFAQRYACRVFLRLFVNNLTLVRFVYFHAAFGLRAGNRHTAHSKVAGKFRPRAPGIASVNHYAVEIIRYTRRNDRLFLAVVQTGRHSHSHAVRLYCGTACQRPVFRYNVRRVTHSLHINLINGNVVYCVDDIIAADTCQSTRLSVQLRIGLIEINRKGRGSGNFCRHYSRHAFQQRHGFG